MSESFRPNHNSILYPYPLSLKQKGVVSRFCHFGLVSFMGFVTEPWHSCYVLFLCECAASSVLEPCALSSCFVLERGVRIPALLSWVSVSYRGSDTRAPCSVSFWEHAVSSSLCRVLFCLRVLLHVVRVLSAACIHVMSCGVWHAACVFNGLHAVMLSCLKWTRGLWVFLLAPCLCPVLHMASDFVLLAMCLCFCFV